MPTSIFLEISLMSQLLFTNQAIDQSSGRQINPYWGGGGGGGAGVSGEPKHSAGQFRGYTLYSIHVTAFS